MTATQPDKPARVFRPDGTWVPTDEEIAAFNARRFASYEELICEWFALAGIKIDPGEVHFRPVTR